MDLVQPIRSFIELLGEFTLFLGNSLSASGRVWRRRALFLRHCEFIGVSSVGILTVAALFLGGVLGYQLYVSLHYFGAEALLGGSVGVGVFRELGPVMAAIMVTGRAGAAIAAEIASMRISEQVDALEVMAISPFEYLVSPRVIAGLVMMPLLAIYFSIVATIASEGIASGVMGLSSAVFWTQFSKVVDKIDLIHCVVKGLVFGFTLTAIACFYGYRASGGARAVGFATRSSVVASCLTILLSDYILTSLLPYGFPVLKAQ